MAGPTLTAEEPEGEAEHKGSMRLVGGPLAERRGCFSADGKRLYACAGSSIRAFSSSTALPISEYTGHAGECTAVVRHPALPNQILSSSLDATLRLWDTVNGTLLRTFEAPGAIEGLIFPGGTAGSRTVFISYHKRKETGGRVASFSLARGQVVDKLAKVSSPAPLVTSLPGGLIATHERHTVLVWAIAPTAAGGHASASSEPLRLHHTKPIVVVALDPREDRVVAGDATGRILIWHGCAGLARTLLKPGGAAGINRALSGDAAAGSAASRLPLSTHHWHTQAVGTLGFTPDGTHLLSGGAEAVLVVWQLSSGSRQFLPRLGAPLRGFDVSPADPAAVCLACADNVHRFVNLATMEVTASACGIRPPLLRTKAAHVGKLVRPAVPAWDPLSGALALPSAGAAVQFYDTVHDRHAGDLSVVGANFVSVPPDADMQAMELHVSALVFSADGRTLVTVDRRADGHPDDPATVVEESLRFWERASAAAEGGAGVAGGFEPATRVDGPHRGAVTALAHHPSAALVVTASLDGEFKTWARGESGKRAAVATWRCRSVGFYQGLPLLAAAFSPDGSLLAVSGGGIVTLWEPLSNALVGTLAAPALPFSDVSRLLFMPGTPHLVTASEGSSGQICVWDLLSLSLSASLQLDCRAISLDSSGARVAAVVRPPVSKGKKERCNDDAVLLLSVPSLRLGAAWLLDAAPAAPSVLPTPSGWVGQAADVLVVSADHKLLFLSTGDDEGRQAGGAGAADPAGPSAAPAAEVEGLSEFEGTFGKLRRAEGLPAVGAGTSGTAGQEAWRGLFDLPSHALPSLAALCPAFLDSLLYAGEEQQRA